MRLRERNRLIGTGNPFSKYSGLWMDIAERCALESTAKRSQVGCVIVTFHGGIYTGYNGTLPNANNRCEIDPDTTSEFVFHAEENALNKMAKDGISSDGSIVFITMTPCVNCAKRLKGSGISTVYFRDQYRKMDGIDFLKYNGVRCFDWEYKEY